MQSIGINLLDPKAYRRFTSTSPRSLTNDMEGLVEGVKLRKISPMVRITLPNPNEYQYPGGIKHFLRQFELCVHHAQKAYEEIVNERVANGEDKYPSDELLVYRQPDMDLYDINGQNKGTDDELPDGYVKVHVDDQTNKGQHLVLEFGEI